MAFFDEVFDHLCLDQHHGAAGVNPTKTESGPRPLVAAAPDKKQTSRPARASTRSCGFGRMISWTDWLPCRDEAAMWRQVATLDVLLGARSSKT